MATSAPPVEADRTGSNHRENEPEGHIGPGQVKGHHSLRASKFLLLVVAPLGGGPRAVRSGGGGTPSLPLILVQLHDGSVGFGPVTGACPGSADDADSVQHNGSYVALGGEREPGGGRGIVAPATSIIGNELCGKCLGRGAYSSEGQ